VIGGNSCPGPNGSPFYPTIPGLVCCSDFKGGSKARCSSSTDSSSVAIPNAMALIEYHTVALEPVLEHPRLLAVSGLRPGPRCAEDCAEAFRPTRTRCLTRSYRAAGSSVGPRWLSIVPCPLRPLGQVGMARVDRAARVAKGPRRANDVLRAGVSPFSADHPRPPADVPCLGVSSRAAHTPYARPRLGLSKKWFGFHV
jgi:hypothetical protein